MAALNLHDWELIEIAINRSCNTINIFLHMPKTSQLKFLSLEGVIQFYLSGMAMQNVILDSQLFEGPNESDYFKYCCSILKIDTSLVTEKRKKVIYLEPSVGAEMACCFADYKIQDADSVLEDIH